jgi:hypothetical protein
VAGPANEPVETPRQLGERYSRELQELVDDGEISRSVAKRIMDDLFEPATPGEPPTVRWSVWHAYVEDADRNASLARLSGLPKRKRVPGT